jgi:N-acetylmuramoyl-L-alanine amidase
MTIEKFIEELARLVKKYAPLYGIGVHSPIIAQAILESDKGRSELAVNAYNFFGLKWRTGRCPTSNGWYIKVGSEQNADGSYTNSIMKWCKFADMENGVIGYFDFINISNYSNLKGVTDPRTYLENIKADGYATSLKYVDNLMKVIESYNLTKYDNMEEVSKMSKKVFIGVGHGGTDPGASKYLVEKDVNLNMAVACKEYLEANGVVVKMSRTKDENDPVAEEVKECNAFGPDLAVDVHNNAGGGDGFEVIASVTGGVSRTLAENIEGEVKKIGQNSRGIKTRKNSRGTDYFAFIRGTKCPAVIVEGVFVDNAEDAKIADTMAKQKAFGVAYAKGILKTLGIQAVEKPDTSTSVPFKVKVSIVDLNIRTGAGKNYERVKFIEVGTYTIVEVKPGYGSKNGWGRLKSGAGWISLDFVERV